MGAETYFRNLQTEVRLNGLSEETGKPIYGRSPIDFVDGRSQKSTRKVIEILRGAVTKGILDPKLATLNKALMANESGGNQPPVESLIHTFTGAAFVNTEFRGSRRWFVNARVLYPGNKGTYDWGNSSNLPDRENIVIVSGPCLFSAPGVRAIDVEGKAHAITDPMSNGNLKKIADIEASRTLQAYEVDSVYRQTGVISSFNPERKVEVAINLPRLEYWYYALDGYEQGLICRELMKKWFAEVDQRASGIERLIRRRLPEGVVKTITSTLGSTEGFLRKAIESDNHQLFDPLVDILGSSDPAWAHAITQGAPNNFQDLGYLSYTIPYLQRAKDASILLVAVENPEETKILDHVMRLLPGFADNAVVLGLYLHSNLILRYDPIHGQGRRFLYFFEPNGSAVEPLREIAAANR